MLVDTAGAPLAQGLNETFLYQAKQTNEERTTERLNMVSHILFESASGYALFERLQSEDIGSKLSAVQQAVLDIGKMNRMVRLVSFVPYKNAAHALENANDISEGIVNDHLKAFLELNLPKANRKSTILGASDRNLAGAIKAEVGVEADASELSMELIRGIRLHADKLLSDLQDGDLEKAALGLGHAYSRAKVKFNVNRSDNMIIQAIALLDQLDKDVNTFSMRVREWYGWHFPELVKIVNDNAQYARLVKLIKNKSTVTDDMVDEIAAIIDDDETKAKNIVDAAKASMGTDIADVDLINIEHFADRVISLAEYRKNLHIYLNDKMSHVAPNLSALIGEVVGARLISHAGSLTNLSKYPASTVQILGAEKALFRALKTKGNTPKYGLIYHSSFIGRAGAKNKGRVSRFLANKCSIASRIDCFTDSPTTKFGEALRGQVEDRLEFYENGGQPAKNAEVMAKVIAALGDAAGESMDIDTPKEKRKKRKSEVEDTPKKKKSKSATEDEETPKSEKKKKKKSKHAEDDNVETPKSDKKKKKKKSKEESD